MSWGLQWQVKHLKEENHHLRAALTYWLAHVNIHTLDATELRLLDQLRDELRADPSTKEEG